ncbi:hypothetical protein ACHAWF_010295 [Thalassiosira exigua]
MAQAYAHGGLRLERQVLDPRLQRQGEFQGQVVICIRSRRSSSDVPRYLIPDNVKASRSQSASPPKEDDEASSSSKGSLSNQPNDSAIS